jgi:protocatechuate 3,4-dioxygenase beta subunit
MQFDRRLFLVTLAGATSVPLAARQSGGPGPARPTGLDAFGDGALPCTSDVVLTPSVSRDASYKPGAPLRSALALAQHGVPLELTGTVAGLSCGPITGATIEFWQPDASGHFDMAGFGLRGRQVTTAGGRYRLTTIVPGAPAGRAPSINVRVVVDRKVELWTAIFFPGQPANRQDPRFKDELLATLGGTQQKRTATFDVRVDL